MVDAGISGNSKKNIEKQSPPGRSGGKADHLWAKGPAFLPENREADGDLRHCRQGRVRGTPRTDE